MNLTDSSFWDDFWQATTLPAVVDRNVSHERCLSDTFVRHLPHDSAMRLFEIGCAPGRWLVWFAQTMGCQVAGCDLSPTGLSKTHQNLALTGVAADLYAGDILTLDIPSHAFDLVLSLGVVEHFADPEPVLARHVELLRVGGLLVLEVPNLTGLNYWLMRATRQDDLLRHHNLRIMNRTWFQNMAAKFGLRTRFLGYVGSFEPALFELRGRPPWVKAIHKILRTLRSVSGADRVNSSLFSAYLVGIFET
ncbi:MAG: class I SAM-dependent methyltransferase [Chloroflexi bacterium]|nr:class I SAM-dependent methyltransferase [Chloroflexota bacterium]